MVQLAGIPKLYEAWIFDEANGPDSPYCVVLTELPLGLKPAKKMTVHVSFDAFFFKKGDYRTLDLAPGKRRVVPLFVGRSLRVLPPLINHDAGFGDGLLIGGMTFLLATVASLFAFALWYRRNDQRVQQRIRAARIGEYVPPPQDAVPMAQPIRPAEAAPPSSNGNHSVSPEAAPARTPETSWPAENPFRN
jgi:hypothetical protein